MANAAPGRILPPVVYAAFIFFLSSRESLPAAAGLVPDKLEHFVLYFGFGWLVARALTKPGASNTISRWLIAALIASAYGATDEWHQAHVPNRTADVADWIADTAGGAAGAFLFGVLSRWRKAKS